MEAVLVTLDEANTTSGWTVFLNLFNGVGFLTIGVAVAAFFIVAESVLVMWLEQIAPRDAFGLYLLGVMAVSTVWGLGLSVMTSVASAVALDYFRNHPAHFSPAAAQNVTAIAVFLVVALVAKREISRGIHPAILSDYGLGPALKAVARRCPVPIDLDVDLNRSVPASTEVATYYVATEALTNVAKHAQASGVTLRVATEGNNLRLRIRDDGIGGADPAKGSGLIGLTDRVEALGGHLEIISHTGHGTGLEVTIPFPVEREPTADYRAQPRSSMPR
jgi:K+-sensing histidine kinase KdpD